MNKGRQFGGGPNHQYNTFGGMNGGQQFVGGGMAIGHVNGGAPYQYHGGAGNGAVNNNNMNQYHGGAGSDAQRCHEPSQFKSVPWRY